jgi:hypothetical protein
LESGAVNFNLADFTLFGSAEAKATNKLLTLACCVVVRLDAAEAELTTSIDASNPDIAETIMNLDFFT